MRLAFVDKCFRLRERVLEMLLANAEPGKLDFIRDRSQPRQPLARDFRQADFTRRLGQKLARRPRKRRHIEFELEEFANDIDDFVEQRLDASRLR